MVFVSSSNLADGLGHWSGAAFIGHRPCAPAVGSIGLGQRPGASDQCSTDRLHRPSHTTAFIYQSPRHDRHLIHICVQCTLLGASLSKHRRCTTFAVSLSHRLHNSSALQSPSTCIKIAFVWTHNNMWKGSGPMFLLLIHMYA